MVVKLREVEAGRQMVDIVEGSSVIGERWMVGGGVDRLTTTRKLILCRLLQAFGPTPDQAFF